MKGLFSKLFNFGIEVSFLLIMFKTITWKKETLILLFIVVSLSELLQLSLAKISILKLELGSAKRFPLVLRL